MRPLRNISNALTTWGKICWWPATRAQINGRFQSSVGGGITSHLCFARALHQRPAMRKCSLTVCKGNCHFSAKVWQHLPDPKGLPIVLHCNALPEKGFWEQKETVATCDQTLTRLILGEAELCVPFAHSDRQMDRGHLTLTDNADKNRERKLTERLSQAELKPCFHTPMNVPPGPTLLMAGSETLDAASTHAVSTGQPNTSAAWKRTTKWFD